MNVTEELVEIRTPNGLMDTWTFEDEMNVGAAFRWPVIVYQDVIGIRPDLKSMAARLASNGFFVVLPNLFYRLGPLPPVDVKAFSTPGPERDRVLARAKTIDGAKTMSDTAAILEYLTESGMSSAIGAVGYCMGGGYALRAAGSFPERIAAAASFHGGALATDAPDSPHRLASEMTGRIYVGVAGEDHMFDEAQRERLRRALDDGGVTFAIEVYEGARHGFAVTGHPAYDDAAAERHWEALLRLFRDTLVSTH
jgi:carboxymethylenebutenolidase